MFARIAITTLPRLPRLPLARMLEIAHQRRALERLDDAALADLGLSRDAARREAARPLWDIAGTCCA
jgi:uncharacterized protein YjiS (DUF1127 family)